MKDTNAVPATNFIVQADATITFSVKPKDHTRVALLLPGMWISAIRLEITPQEIRTQESAGRKRRNSTAIGLSSSLKPKDGKETKLPFHFADADHKAHRYVMSLPVIGVKDLWQVSAEHE